MANVCKVCTVIVTCRFGMRSSFHYTLALRLCNCEIRRNTNKIPGYIAPMRILLNKMAHTTSYIDVDCIEVKYHHYVIAAVSGSLQYSNGTRAESTEMFARTHAVYYRAYILISTRRLWRRQRTPKDENEIKSERKVERKNYRVKFNRVHSISHFPISVKLKMLLILLLCYSSSFDLPSTQNVPHNSGNKRE